MATTKTLVCAIFAVLFKMSSSMFPEQDDKFFVEKRLEAFKSNFLAKLRLDQVPKNPKENISFSDLDESIKLAYEDAVNSLSDSYSGECSRCQQCQRPDDTDNYYAEVLTAVKGSKHCSFPCMHGYYFQGPHGCWCTAGIYKVWQDL